jgi:hypothetical protein
MAHQAGQPWSGPVGAANVAFPLLQSFMNSCKTGHQQALLQLLQSGRARLCRRPNRWNNHVAAQHTTAQSWQPEPDSSYNQAAAKPLAAYAYLHTFRSCQTLKRCCSRKGQYVCG